MPRQINIFAPAKNAQKHVTVYPILSCQGHLTPRFFDKKCSLEIQKRNVISTYMSALCYYNEHLKKKYFPKILNLCCSIIII
jgi:hypothetical protein